MKNTIESIILRHSARGMDVLKDYVPADFCSDAARYICSFEKGNVFVTTGFYVGGYAETDGPLGTLVMVKALQKCGYTPYVITDTFCKGYFDDYTNVIYAPFDADEDYYKELIETYHPTGMISIERCGENINGDYANMRSISIKENTAAVDHLFTLAPGYHIPTVGVGDGGNEIGMGNLADVITNKLSLVPCKICVDKLVLATVSNWGCYGLAHCMEEISNQKLLMTEEEILSYLDDIVALGCVDGVSKENVATVDGYSPEIEKEIIQAVHSL